MNFDEMKKIWDKQRSETLYTINERALHKQIKHKMSRTGRLVNILEQALIVISLAVAGSLFYDAIIEPDDPFSYVAGAFMAIAAIYLFVIRRKRIQNENRFDRTMLGDLDHAISYADYLIVLAKKIIWWYNVPLVIMVIAKFIYFGSEITSWLILIPLFVLAYFLGRWELRSCHIPRKEKLLRLRENLTATTEREVA